MIDEKKLNDQLMNELDNLLVRILELEAAEVERKHAEEALRESEERFRGIAEGSFDIIFMMDQDGAFTYISPAVERILGYRPDEILGKPLEEFLPDSEIPKTQHALAQFKNGETIEGLELSISSKEGSTVFFEINANSILKEEKLVGFQGIARDITERKHAEKEIKKRLMKFKLDEGKLYLIQEATQIISHEAFRDMLNVGYKGIFISRTPRTDFKYFTEGNFEFYWLSENKGKNTLSPNLNEIENKIKNRFSRKIVLIDRLDYLISKHNFKKVLLFIQRVREHAIISNHIVILSIDPSTVSKRQLRLLEKETFKVETLFRSKLPEYLLEVVRFIYEQNLIGKKPSYSEIGLELGLCKPTARKRIRLLLSGGHIVQNPRGRSKIIELTERGKTNFSK